jgi:uncharacterized protein (TIGR01777 family)
MNILITGATGFIGREMGKALVRQGHQISALSRNAHKAEVLLPFPCQVIEGDLTQKPLAASKLSHIQAVLHLAGENIGDGRWTEERKKKILHSRVEYTENLLQSLPKDLQVFVAASAVGYYGNSGNEIQHEASPPGAGFLADVCVKWESASFKGRDTHPQTRFVVLRNGVVFGPYGGALMKMLTPFQMGVGGVLGSGEQWMSWIHLQDLVSLYAQALENPKYSGVYNAVSPEPVQNKNFTKILAESLGKKGGPSVPAFAIKLLFGEMGSVVLDSQKVSSEKIEKLGFQFQFPKITQTLENCAAPYRDGTSAFHSEHFLPFPRKQVFPFFADAENLGAITPSSVTFKLNQMSTNRIEKGTLIDYQLKIHGVPLRWRTLIEDWQPEERFVDSQVKGPYSQWHHTHEFEELAGGTLMTDTVRYKLPVGPLGALAAGGFVKGDVEKIFDYRRKTIPTLLK